MKWLAALCALLTFGCTGQIGENEDALGRLPPVPAASVDRVDIEMLDAGRLRLTAIGSTTSGGARGALLKAVDRDRDTMVFDFLIAPARSISGAAVGEVAAQAEWKIDPAVRKLHVMAGAGLDLPIEPAARFAGDPSGRFIIHIVRGRDHDVYLARGSAFSAIGLQRELARNSAGPISLVADGSDDWSAAAPIVEMALYRAGRKELTLADNAGAAVNLKVSPGATSFVLYRLQRTASRTIILPEDADAIEMDALKADATVRMKADADAQVVLHPAPDVPFADVVSAARACSAAGCRLIAIGK